MPRRVQTLLLLLVIVASGLILVSCESRGAGDSTRSCDELVLAGQLQAAALTASDVPGLTRWVTGAFGLPGSAIKTVTYLREDVSLEWTHNGIAYTVYGNRRNPLSVNGVIIGYQERPPSFQRLLGCLQWGDPDYYEAYWERASPSGMRYSVKVYYTGRGAALFSGEHYFGRSVPTQPPALDQTLPLHVMRMARPQGINDLYREVNNGVEVGGATRLQGWPGGWDRLEYVILP